MTDRALQRLVETLVDKGIFSKEDEEYVLDALEEDTHSAYVDHIMHTGGVVPDNLQEWRPNNDKTV